MELQEGTIADLAPRGVLRAALNLGNPLLVKRFTPDADPVGLSVDLATELSDRLALPLKLVCFPGAGKVFEAAGSDVWDVAFLAIDRTRMQEMSFTSPYVTLEGSFAVRAGSAITRNEEVDRVGVRIVVGKGSAYDLHLSAVMKHAEIVRVPTSDLVVSTMVREGYEVAAGVRQPLAQQMLGFPGLHLLDGAFMTIQQAMAARKDCTLGLEFLQAFVEETKASGFVARGLLRHAVEGVTVAEAAS